MIDENKLIKVLKDEMLRMEFDERDESYNFGIDVAIFHAQTQPKVGEWTPVEERLPKHYGQYLITAINDYEGIYMAVSNYDSQYKSFSSDGVEDDNAIAWMDLPKLYEARE
jgi:hypothetical protein